MRMFGARLDVFKSGVAARTKPGIRECVRGCRNEPEQICPAWSDRAAGRSNAPKPCLLWAYLRPSPMLCLGSVPVRARRGGREWRNTPAPRDYVGFSPCGRGPETIRVRHKMQFHCSGPKLFARGIQRQSRRVRTFDRLSLRTDPPTVTAPARRMAGNNCTQRRGLQLSLTGRRCRGEGIVGFAEKSLLDLRCDLSQPFFRAVRSLPIMPKVSLEALYALFGILKLVRELLRYVDCMVVVFCTYLRRLVKEGQNVLPRDVQAIRRI